MNKVHTWLVAHMRELTEVDQNPLSKKMLDKSDEQLVRMMFQNFRGNDKKARGLRLTNFGLTLMRSYFQAYEIKMPEGAKVGTKELVFLDRKAKLPYHISDSHELVLFDAELGIKLKLADGNLKTLIDMDSLMSDSVNMR